MGQWLGELNALPDDLVQSSALKGGYSLGVQHHLVASVNAAWMWCIGKHAGPYRFL